MASAFINVDEASPSTSCDSNPDADACYGNSLESSLAPCFMRDIKSEPSDDYSTAFSETGYPDSHNLTQLTGMTYRANSDSESPPVYAGMNPISDSEQYLINDHLGLTPVDIHEEQPIRTQPLLNTYEPEDYRNMLTLAPFISNHETESEEIPKHILQCDPIVNGHVQNSELKKPRQCPKCGRETSDAWWPDSTGNYLCDFCYGLPQLEKPKPRPQRRSSQKKNLNQTCSNCQTTHTSLWRRDPNSNTVCNACGLYFKLHGCDRPLNMRKDSIQKRKRKPKSPKRDLKGSNGIHPSPIPSENGVASVTSTSCPPQPLYTTQANFVHVSKDSIPTVHVLPPVHSPDGFRNSMAHYSAPFASTRVTHNINGPICNSSVFNGSQSHYERCDESPKSGTTSSPTISSLLQNSNHPHFSRTFQN